MRVRIDRGGEALRLERGGAAAARRVEAADGVAVGYDADGRIVEIEVRGVDPAALHEFTVELAGLADRPAPAAPAQAVLAPDGRMRGATEAAPPPPPAYTGPLTWDPEAEAAILQVPFFTAASAGSTPASSPADKGRTG